MSHLKHSLLIGRPVRQDPPNSLGTPTRRFLETAMRNGRTDEAKDWLEYYLVEQAAVVNIYEVWNWYMVRYYLDHKPDSRLKDLLELSIAPWLGTTIGLQDQPIAEVSVDGMNARLMVEDLMFHLTEGEKRFKLTSGTPEEYQERHLQWRRSVEAAIDDGNLEQVTQLVDDHVPEDWMLNDIGADWAWSLLSVMMREWGEEALDEVLHVTEEPWVTSRYANLKDMAQEEALQLTVEGMRGHFTGPERAGLIHIQDEPDRWVMSFDACGSGGRMRRGDPLVGSGSRLDPPYNFLNVEGAYDWTWNQEGVCAYCAHCAVVNQILPIEELGYPMRMTEYPENPDEPCRWIIYKDRHGFPDKAYTSVGKSGK